MGWFLFLDESGQDRRESPYEVLAGVAVEDRKIWHLIQGLKEAQDEHFGLKFFNGYGLEAKGTKLLKKKTYKLAAQKPPIAPELRRELAYRALTNGAGVQGDQLVAMAQAKLAYVDKVMALCRQSGVVAFASIIPNNLPRPAGQDFLRKDYAFLFERFYHFLNSRTDQPKPIGTIVFDELDKQLSQTLVDQMEAYFLNTNKGRVRSRLILPEPLFVHSDLTSMIQVADLFAYVISWGVRLKGGARPMTEPHRPELATLATEICRMRYHSRTPAGHDTWGFYVIGNLNANDGAG